MLFMVLNTVYITDILDTAIRVSTPPTLSYIIIFTQIITSPSV